MQDKLTRAAAARLDFVGAAVLLSSSILIVFGFEEAGSRYPWSSPVVISTIAIGGSLFLAFFACEYLVGKPQYPQEPVFPLRLMKDRHFVGLILIAFFTGPAFMTALINLPQRFQAVNGLSPFNAGVHLLPLLLSSPLATAVSGHLATKWDVPPFYLLLFGATMQMLGIGLASSAAPNELRHLLGFEVIMGFGFGMTLVTLLIYVPFLVDRADLEYLDPSEMQAILNSVQFIETLPSSTQTTVRSVFNEGYNLQLRTMLYFSAVVLVSMTLIWDRNLKRARDMTGY
ncbi:efflux pump dotC [Colletotrichum spaethianum]|uniref:Efflux pump dotC n=1 Tax=Colletotrichum spaethianum TaxID=700344 RepID=A0AA37NXR0_9PEZI|nr:efflux pump dotC [Colletotrichum spaethianum]GKT45457.1 efflux pump dotC [Colletotrichum spaethianum]